MKFFLTVIIILSFVQFLNSQVIFVDTTISYQTIQGWECGSSTVAVQGKNIETDTSLSYFRNDLINIIADSIGITRMRLEVRSGSENSADNWRKYIDSSISYDDWRAIRYATVNDNDDPDILNMDGFHFSELKIKMRNSVLPLRERLKEKGENLYINLCYVAFTPQITDGDFHHRDPREYAEFILAVFKFMDSEYGFVPDAVEVILEPDVAKFGDGKLVGECMVAAGDKLKENGYFPEFIAPSTTNLINANSENYIGKFLKVPRVFEYWKEFSYHAYTGRVDSNLTKIADLAKANNVRTSMLEWWTNGNTYETLHKDLTLGNNSAFQHYSPLCIPFGVDYTGLTKIVFNSQDDYRIIIHDNVKYILQYFKNIRPRAVRKHAISNNSILNPVVFKNTNGNYVAIVTSQGKSDINIVGLPRGEYELIYTTGWGNNPPTNYMVSKPNQIINENDTLKTNISDRGLIVIKQIDKISHVDNIEVFNRILISPNPASEYIDISGLINPTLKHGVDERGVDEVAGEIKIYNTFGELFMSLNPALSHEEREIRIDISLLPIGIYFIQIGNYSAKFMVIK
ncbi:MAG: hypothetical protein KIT33_01555 [Candidatus Kapabacteria bacterium]|nr:hypothetical protein [Ignavibacteriota bacterium]MCW5883636.1 hypothetical protein [Candidatus Kapabacteria bacterium]